MHIGVRIYVLEWHYSKVKKVDSYSDTRVKSYGYIYISIWGATQCIQADECMC